MNNRYATLFNHLDAAGQHAYMPYVMLGYPTLEASLMVAENLLNNGAHGLELGLPFSDPLADGPVIQAAGQTALANGFKTEQALAVIGQLRQRYPDTPLTLMVYYNMVLAKGVEKFVADF